MRNYTLRIVKGSSLFSLLIITLWVLPVGTSCYFKNSDNRPIQADHVLLSRNQVAGNPEEIATEESTWICVVCRYDNGEYEAMCHHCNAVKHQEHPVQSQEDREGIQEKKEIKEEGNEANDLQEDKDPDKEDCPVCLNKFTNEEQAACKYWVCNHFVCEQCYGQIKATAAKKELMPTCPLCRNAEPSKDTHSSQQGQPQ